MTKEKQLYGRASLFLGWIKNEANEGRNPLNLSGETLDAIKNNEKRIFTADEYHRAKFSGTQGIIKMMLPTTDREDGFTTFDKAKLEAGKVLCITGIGFRYGYSATSVAADTVRYSSSEYLATFHTGIVNSELKIEAGQQEIIRCRTSKFLANAFAEYGSSNNIENIVELEQPKIIDSKQLVNIQHQFGSGSAAPSGTQSHYGEYVFFGAVLVDKN